MADHNALELHSLQAEDFDAAVGGSCEEVFAFGVVGDLLHNRSEAVLIVRAFVAEDSDLSVELLEELFGDGSLLEVLGVLSEVAQRGVALSSGPVVVQSRRRGPVVLGKTLLSSTLDQELLGVLFLLLFADKRFEVVLEEVCGAAEPLLR